MALAKIRPRLGSYVVSRVGGEQVRAFVPPPVAPEPPILLESLQSLFREPIPRNQQLARAFSKESGVTKM